MVGSGGGEDRGLEVARCPTICISLFIVDRIE